MWYTYWWGIVDEDSDMYGEEFFTELKEPDRKAHRQYVKEIFGNVKVKCYGQVSEYEAECMGLDTY